MTKFGVLRSFNTSPSSLFTQRLQLPTLLQLSLKTRILHDHSRDVHEVSFLNLANQFKMASNDLAAFMQERMRMPHSAADRLFVAICGEWD